MIDGLMHTLRETYPNMQLEIRDIQLVNKPSLTDLMQTFESEIAVNHEVLSDFTRDSIKQILMID